MLLIVANKLAAAVTQSYHVDVLVFLFIVKCVDEVILGTFPEPLRHLLNFLVSCLAVTVRELPTSLVPPRLEYLSAAAGFI